MLRTEIPSNKIKFNYNYDGYDSLQAFYPIDAYFHYIFDFYAVKNLIEIFYFLNRKY